MRPRRPPRTVAPSSEGTGLGLAIVYGIVKQNNGFINVYAEPGQGSTFSLYLPRYLGAGAPDEAPAAPGVIVRGHETVLLVEDEPTMLRVSSTALVNLGYEVLAASMPAEALRIAESHPGPIDVLLTDVVMPEMNGRDLAARLRARRPGIACVYMSGYTADVIAPAASWRRACSSSRSRSRSPRSPRNCRRRSRRRSARAAVGAAFSRRLQIVYFAGSLFVSFFR